MKPPSTSCSTIIRTNLFKSRQISIHFLCGFSKLIWFLLFPCDFKTGFISESSQFCTVQNTLLVTSNHWAKKMWLQATVSEICCYLPTLSCWLQLFFEYVAVVAHLHVGLKQVVTKSFMTLRVGYSTSGPQQFWFGSAATSCNDFEVQKLHSASSYGSLTCNIYMTQRDLLRSNFQHKNSQFLELSTLPSYSFLKPFKEKTN